MEVLSKKVSLALKGIKNDYKTMFCYMTPIYYPSGKLHIGPVYTTIACDLGSLQAPRGYDVFI